MIKVGFIGNISLEWMGGFNYLKNLLFYKKPEVLSSEIRNKAMKYFTNDIDRLETLMGRSLSLWNQH